MLARSHGYSAGSWATHNYYHADGGGNITMLIDASPVTVANYRYDCYGNIITMSGGLASANLYRFSSKEFMYNSGLYYYGYRFYDPNLQRWLNRDPIGDHAFLITAAQKSGDLVLFGSAKAEYTFCFNSPVLYQDALGLYTEEERKEVCTDYQRLNPGMSSTKAGGIVCYCGQAYPCLFGKEHESYDPAIQDCMLKHEGSHADDAKKSKLCNSQRTDRYEPDWKPHDAHASECKAHQVMWNCLKENREKHGYWAALSKITNYLKLHDCPNFIW